MKIQYTLQPSDYTTLSLWVFSKSKTFLIRRIMMVVVAMLFSSTVVVSLLYGFFFTVLAIFSLLCACYFIFALVFIKWRYERELNKKFEQRIENKKVPDVCTLSILKNKIKFESEGFDTNIEISQIEKITETSFFYFFHTPVIDFIIIPKRCLGDAKETVVSKLDSLPCQIINENDWYWRRPKITQWKSI